MEKIKCNDCQYFTLVDNNYEYCCYYCSFLSTIIALELCAFTRGYDKEEEDVNAEF